MFSRNIDDLKTMLPCEYEEWRERGDDFRRTLTHAIMRHLVTPEFWQVNAEYRTEFGGLLPVQCRFTPSGTCVSVVRVKSVLPGRWRCFRPAVSA